MDLKKKKHDFIPLSSIRNADSLHSHSGTLSPREILEQAYDLLAPVFFGVLPVGPHTGKHRDMLSQPIPGWLKGGWQSEAWVAFVEQDDEPRELAYQVNDKMVPVKDIAGNAAPHAGALVQTVCSMGAMLMATGLLDIDNRSDHDSSDFWSRQAIELFNQDHSFLHAVEFLTEAIYVRYSDFVNDRYRATEIGDERGALERIQSAPDAMMDLVISWNDQPDRKHHEVLDVFRDAIKLAVES